MKKSLMATLITASMLSPMAFAAEPMELNATQMDNVTAGFADTFDLTRLNINIAPTIQIVNQIAVAVTIGSGSSSAFNVAAVTNDVRQR